MPKSKYQCELHATTSFHLHSIHHHLCNIGTVYHGCSNDGTFYHSGACTTVPATTVVPSVATMSISTPATIEEPAAAVKLQFPLCQEQLTGGTGRDLPRHHVSITLVEFVEGTSQVSCVFAINYIICISFARNNRALSVYLSFH